MFSPLTLELVAELRRNCGNQTYLQSLQSMFNLTAPSPPPPPSPITAQVGRLTLRTKKRRKRSQRERPKNNKNILGLAKHYDLILTSPSYSGSIINLPLCDCGVMLD